MSQASYWKPKFIQSGFAQASAIVLVATGAIGPGEYVTVTLASLAIYSGAVVYENKVLVEKGQIP